MSDPQTVYSTLSEIFLILDDGDRRLLSQFNLSTSRFYALINLGEKPGLSLSQLSSMMLCDKSNTTRIIRSLEADGLVIRRPHETDGRTVRLYLTEAGKQVRQKATTAHQSYNRTRFDDLQDLDQDTLLEKLLFLKKSLRRRLGDKNLALR